MTKYRMKSAHLTNQWSSHTQSAQNIDEKTRHGKHDYNTETQWWHGQYNIKNNDILIEAHDSPQKILKVLKESIRLSTDIQ